MSSFIFHPEPEEKEMNVTSSIIQEIHLQQNSSNSIPQRMTKSLSMNTSGLKRKKTKLQRGLTYGSSLKESHFQQENQEYEGEKLTRSVKVMCSGPVQIITDIQELNYQYLPKKKLQSTSSLRNSQKELKIIAPANPQKDKEPEQVNRGIQPNQPAQQKIWQQILNVRPSKSWDEQQKQQNRIHKYWSVYLLIIIIVLLLSFAHPQFKKNFKEFSKTCYIGIFQ